MTMATLNLIIDGVTVPVQLDTSLLPAGPVGPAGPAGPAGPPGAQGPAGASGSGTVDIPTLATAVAAQLASTVAVVDIKTLAQEVEAQIQATPPPASVTIPPATSITDSKGNVWTVVAGVVQMNGKPAGFSANVTELVYVNQTIWQTANGSWFSWTGTTWSAGTTTAPL